MQHNGGEERRDGRVETLRTTTFPMAWRGYDRTEVDRFLGETAEWVEGLMQQGADATVVQRQLSKVGEQTAGILGLAEETARRMRTEAADEMENLRAGARDEVAKARAEADSYARSVRTAADEEANSLRAEAEEDVRRRRIEASSKVEKMLAEAAKKADEVVAEAVRRRNRLRSATEQLKRDRTQILDDAGALADELSKVVATHAEITKRVSSRADGAERVGAGEGQPEAGPADPNSLLD